MSSAVTLTAYLAYFGFVLLIMFITLIPLYFMVKWAIRKALNDILRNDDLIQEVVGGIILASQHYSADPNNIAEPRGNSTRFKIKD